MAFKERSSTRFRNQGNNGHLNLIGASEQAKSPQRNDQTDDTHFCPQCGAVMTWWRNSLFCAHCGWREGCCD